MIKRIKLYVNNNDKSIKNAKIVKDKFTHHGYIIDDKKYDLAVAVGGDGAFLRMVHSNNFDSNLYYVGVNSGTLGFAQEINLIYLDRFIEEINTDEIKIEEVGVEETEVRSKNKIDSFYSLNEIVVRYKDSKIVKLDVQIDNSYLERFRGDGIIIATSFGSTAHNLSYGGSIVYPNLSTLQITPIGPINSKAYHTLSNSLIVPKNRIIKLIPNSEDKAFTITSDGVLRKYQDISSIKTHVGDKKIKQLRMSTYSFPNKINEKLLSN